MIDLGWSVWTVVVAVVALVAAHLATTAVVRWSPDTDVTGMAPRCVGSDAHRLSPPAVVPILSWVRNRARCRTCGTRIPRRLLAVEVATIVVLVATAWLHPGPELLLLVPVVWSAVVATPIDLAHRIIPNRLTYPLAAWSVVVAPALAVGGGDWSRWRWSMVVGLAVPLGLLAVSLVFELLRGQPGIGMGDIKWSLSLGVALGWLGPGPVVSWLLVTVAASGIVGIVLVATGHARAANRIPYGPYLALGTIVGVFGGDTLITLLYG